jgi:Ca2+-binding EF-hand superfamily protein
LNEFCRLIDLLYYYNHLSDLFGQLDTNKDKRISFSEFKRGHELTGHSDIDEDYLREEFHRIDTNHGGYILFDEVC